MIIGNANNETVSQSLFLFANTLGQADMTITGSRIGIQKSGSLNATLDVNGDVLITGSLTVSQSIFGNLTGTASYASQALTSSYALTATSASYALTSSYSTIATSASYAATASYADTFVVGSGTIAFDGTLTDYYSVASSINGPNNLFTRSTGSFTSAFYKYTVSNGTNARTGEVMAVWNNGSVQYTDLATQDLGSTNAVTASVSIVSSQAQLNFQTNTSGWTIRALATYI